MDLQKPKITMYVQRSFGDKLTAAFNFFNENWKVLLKYCTYFLLPICLVQALSLNKFLNVYTGMFASGGSDALDSLGTSFWLNYGFLILFSGVGGLLVTSLIYSLVMIYNEREERLANLTFADLKPLFLRNMKRLFFLGLFLTGVLALAIIIISILTVIGSATLFLTIPALIACTIPLSLFIPIYLFENIDIWSAFTKSFRLGFATWGGIFGVSFVMSFISNMLCGVASIPWSIVYAVGLVFSVSDVQSAVTSSIGYSFMTYLVGAIMLFGVYIATIFPVLGLIYQYGHACEKMENVTVVDDIDKFEQL